MMFSTFHMSISHLDVLCEMPVQVVCALSPWVFCLFYLLVGISIKFCISVLYFKYLFPLCGLPF